MNHEWSSLKLDPRITELISSKFKFDRMTPVQAATIPLFLKRKDVTVEAVTGSGKTLAFILPVIQMVLDKKNEMMKKEKKIMSPQDVIAVIVSPTIELAKQINCVLSEFVRDESFKNLMKGLCFVGGSKSSVRDEDKFTKYGGNIIVSTPGRFAELLENCPELRSSVRKNLEILVLDEADQLLSMGFEKTINEILQKLPKQRRTCLFSATQTKQLEQLVRAGLRNPVRIEIKAKNQAPLQSSSTFTSVGVHDEKQVNSTGLEMSPFLNNYYLPVNSYSSKLSYAINFILNQGRCSKTLIFFSTCAQVDYFSLVIDHFVQLHSTSENPVAVFKIHRKLQKKRSAIFSKFSQIQFGTLLCTDVMSRGIDIKNIDWVLHFDLPNTLQHYIHRSGRSGHQVGQVGNSLLLTMTHEEVYLKLCSQKNIDLKLLQGRTNCTLADERDQIPKDDLVSQQSTEEGEKHEFFNDGTVIKEFEITSYMKDEARKDSSFYELALTAFVSFVRSYSSKNVLSQTLFNEIDVIALVNSFGLLKIPIMPELKSKLKSCPSKFIREENDRNIVENHKVKLTGEKGEGKEEGKRSVSKTNRKRMRKKIKETKLQGKRKKELIDDLEFNELAEDARVIKKLKKGKISKEEFDEHFSF